MSRRCDREKVLWDDRLTIGEHAYTKDGLPCDALELLWGIRTAFGRVPKDHVAMMDHLRDRPTLPPWSMEAREAGARTDALRVDARRLRRER